MKKYLKYILFFILFLISFLFLPKVAADETWSYGFSYNIATGLVPYRDFNMIVPPFFAFLFSIGLFFYKGILMFHIEQALLLVGICILLEKLLKEKSLIFILALLVLTPMIYNLPTYNILAFFLALLLVILEKNQKSDFFIGIVLGLSFLTKQSIGLIIIFVGIYLCRSDIRKLKKRLLGMILPIFLCFFYFLFTNSFYDFFDQCFLGLFLFSENSRSASFYQPIGVILVFFLFAAFFYKKKIPTFFFYLIAYYSVSIPLFDYTHFLIGLFSLFVVMVAVTDLKISSYLKLALYLLIIGIPLTTTALTLSKGNYPNDIKNYEFRYLDEDSYHNLKVLKKYHEDHSDYEIVILSCASYIFKITNQLPISKLDLINTGNWGRNGSDQIISLIQKKKGKKVLFLIDQKELSYNNQIDKKALKYVISQGKVVDQILYFDVYKLN